MTSNRIIIKKSNCNKYKQIEKLIELENSRNNIKPHFHAVHFESQNPCLENYNYISGACTYSNGYFFHAFSKAIDDFQKLQVEADRAKILILHDYTLMISSYDRKERQSIEDKIGNLISTGALQNIYVWLITLPSHSSRTTDLNLDREIVSMCDRD